MRIQPTAALLLSAAGSLLAGTAAHAATFGSQTKVTISATYTLPGTRNETNFPSGAYRLVETVETVRHGNREILEAMVRRELIPTIKGYSLVMLRTALGTHSYTFVAAHATLVNVRVPEDLLSLAFDDGPRKGRYAYNPQGTITELTFQSYNLAMLTLAGFEGQAILKRKSGYQNLTRNGVTHTIRLDSGTAAFDGDITIDSDTGVGTATLTLSGARIVDLEDFGAAAPEDEEEEATESIGGSTSFAGTGVNSSSGTLTIAPITLSVAGTDFISSSGTWTLSSGFSYSFSESTGLLTISSIGGTENPVTTP